MTESNTIVAMDFPNADDVFQMLAKLDEGATPDKKNCLVKIGKELFTAEGPNLVKRIMSMGYKEVFLDLKYHDIPNTVAAACEKAADMGVWMVNLHALGGRKMMEETMNRLQKRRIRPIVTAVTLLTSMQYEDAQEVGLQGSPKEIALRLAKLAHSSGVDGVVSSPLETEFIRKTCGDDFIIVNPGIRFAGDDKNDQNRISTPGTAIQNGADYIVVGRSITTAENPAAALVKANNEVSKAKAGLYIP